MQKPSNDFLITQVLSIQEVGVWAIFSSFYDQSDIIENSFIDKTFSLKPRELLKILERLQEYEIIEKIDDYDDDVLISFKLSNSLFIY